jgi:hypothetical protein
MEREIIEQLTRDLEALRIRVAQLEEAAAATTGQEQDGNRGREAETTVTTEFKEGDRVRIKNQLKKPATWPNKVFWDKKQAQQATVTHIYKEQVHFVTDNGVKTWRAVNNLALIE